MPDQYEPRDFMGNLYPPPSAKGMADAPARAVATEEVPAPVDVSAPKKAALAVSSPSKPEGVYRVVDRPDGTRRMYYSRPDSKTIDRGIVIAPTETLNAVGRYNEQGKVWEIPEEYALRFERGSPGHAEHVANSFEGAEAGMHMGLVGYLAVTKKMPYDEAIYRTEPDLVKAQLTDLPQAAWGDSRLQQIVGASKWALGVAAEILPSQIGNLMEGAKAAPSIALGATAVAATGGPAGLAALATPPAILTVAGMSWKYGAFDFTSKVTTGNLALEMKRKGLDDKTIETVAPIAGMFAGALEILHVKYLPAPWRRALAAKVFNNGAAKKAMTHWLTNYFKETGAEVGVEVAQQYIEGFATNIMAEMDERPDVAKSWATMNAEAGKVALKTAVGMGLIKAPGAAFEAGVSRAQTKADAAAPKKAEAAAEPKALSLVEKAVADSEIKPTAPALEQELVKAEPEVAAALTELNTELDPLAEDAAIEYEAMGSELAGNENAEAAVMAKVEALRSEMYDILAEEDNSPLEQRRVVEIQNEIGLLEGMQEKMAEDLPVIDTQWAESNQMATPKETEFVEGKRFRDAFGDRPYVYEAKYVDPRTLLGNLNLEGRTYDEVVNMPSTQKYIEWYKAGKVPPPIDVVMSDEGPRSVNRRRIVAAVEAGVTKIPANVEVGRTAKRPITGAKKRVQKQIVAAREKKLNTDLNNTLAMVKELEASRTRLEKAGRSVVFINDQIAKLMGEVYKIDEARAKLAETGEVAKGEVLELKPATLASITKAAFKEGRADVITKRATLIKEVAEQNSLSDRDIKTLIKNRNLGTMTDFEFKTFIDKVREDAKALADKKQAAIELHAAQEAKSLKNEASLRKINNLPPVSKMTAEQMRTYAELIEGYEAGETFWTPKRIEALKNTVWEGSETVGDVLKKAAGMFNVPLADLAAVTVGEFDRFRYDTALARRHPLYNFMVDTVLVTRIKNDTAYIDAHNTHLTLAEEAAKSRDALDAGKKSVWDRIANYLAPQQAEVMTYMEAETPEARASAAAALTPAELKWAEYMEGFYAGAYQYLLAGHDIQSSKYAEGGYAPHLRRPLAELLRGLPKNGIRQTVSDFVNSWRTDQLSVTVTDQKTGAPLGFHKFFRQTLHRSGELTPSKNMVRSTDLYMRQFFRKKAIDEAAPTVDTLVKAIITLDKTEAGRKAGTVLQAFVNDYLNAKKGQATMLGVVQGGKVEAVINTTRTAMSLWTMGFNSVAQIAAPIGETVAVTTAIGHLAYAKALYRQTTKQGREIVKRYEAYVGEAWWKELTHLGKTIDERAMVAAFSVFGISRVQARTSILLGSMTDAEFAAGRISDARLVEITKVASRWVDMGGMKSVYGSTALWKSETQFKSWAIPIMSSSVDILSTALKSMAGGKNLLSTQQILEVKRASINIALAALALQLAGDIDKNDDSWLGRMKYKVLTEINTLLQAVNPALFLVGPASFNWLGNLLRNVTMLSIALATGGNVEGQWASLKRKMPASLRHMGFGGKKKPKGPPKPVKFKRERGD